MDLNILIVICTLCAIICAIFALTRFKRVVYVDKTWRGFNIEYFRFTDKGKTIIFVIFSGLKDRLEGGEILELEGEMEDLGIIPLFPKKDTKNLPSVFLIDRNTGYRYKYCGKYAKVKFERCTLKNELKEGY